jgi:hypothetical protein
VLFWGAGVSLFEGCCGGVLRAVGEGRGVDDRRPCCRRVVLHALLIAIAVFWPRLPAVSPFSSFFPFFPLG